MPRLDLEALCRRVARRVLAERGGAPAPPGREIERDRRRGVAVEWIPPGGPPRPAGGGLPEAGGEAGAPPRAATGPGGAAPAAARVAATGWGGGLVTARDLAGVPDGGRVEVPSGARLTPLAEEEVWRRGLVLAVGSCRRVAVGADHGGFELKRRILAWLRELGCTPLDLGTYDERPCDYPDFARRVAEAVASGRCELGVVVDGAGIGSAICANKVPGVRAATCWNERTARNAREHNGANVLSLGAGTIEEGGARSTLAAFLGTELGAERHRRRVAKIIAVERRYLREPAARGVETGRA